MRKFLRGFATILACAVPTLLVGMLVVTLLPKLQSRALAQVVMPVTVTKTIGSNSRDFPTLQAWEDARDGNLITRQILSVTPGTGNFTANETIVGQTSNCQGSYIPENHAHTNGPVMTLDNLAGTCQSGETLTGQTSQATATFNSITSSTGTIEKGEAYKDSVFTAGITIDGSTTDQDHYLWLTAADGQRHAGVSGTGVKISVVNVNLITVSDSFTKIHWLELTNNISGTYKVSAIRTTVGTNSLDFRNNLIYDFTTYGLSLADNGGTTRIINNIFSTVGAATGRHAIIIYSDATNGTFQIYNNTFFNIYRAMEAYKAPFVSAKNNIAAQCTSACFGSGIDEASNNASSDASATGSGSLTGITTGIFHDAAAKNFHLSPQAVVINAGVDLSAIFTDDIDGVARDSQWDMGADEFTGVIVDTTPSQTSATPPGGTYSQPLSVVLSSNNEPAQIFYTTDGTLPTEQSSSGQNSVTVDVPQSLVLQYFAKDAAGNVEDYKSQTYTIIPPACVENWSCTPWSACADGTQTRSCVDLNNCGTTENQPSLSQSCDSTAPQVSLTAPANGATVSGTITITATAQDSVAVASVEFKVDSAVIMTDTAAPYSASWYSSTVANGAHTLTATARDTSGNMAASSVIVTTNNPSAVPVTLYNVISEINIYPATDLSGATYNVRSRTAFLLNEEGGMFEVDQATNTVLRTITTLNMGTYDLEAMAYVRTEADGRDVFAFHDEAYGRLLFVRFGPADTEVDLSTAKVYSTGFISGEAMAYDAQADNNIFYVMDATRYGVFRLNGGIDDGTLETVTVKHLKYDLRLPTEFRASQKDLFINSSMSPYLYKLGGGAVYVFNLSNMQVVAKYTFLVTGKVEGLAFDPQSGRMVLTREASPGYADYFALTP